MDNFDLNNNQLMIDLEEQLKSNPSQINYMEEVNGISLLVMAISTGNLDFAEWLVINNAEVNTFVDGTPLSKACFEGNPKLIKQILDKCNEKYRYLCNPMSSAIYSTKTTHVDVLLKNGFGINTPDEYGCTPLYYAISAIEVIDINHDKDVSFSIKNHFKMIEFLLSKGALLDENSKEALTYLFELRCSDTNRDILSVLSYVMLNDYVKSTRKEKKPILLNVLKLLLTNGANTEYSFQTTEFANQQIKIKDDSKNQCFLTDFVKLDNSKPFNISIPYVKITELPQEVQAHLIYESLSDNYVESLLKKGLNPNSYYDVQDDLSILGACIKSKSFNYSTLLINYGAAVDKYNKAFKGGALSLLISGSDKELDESNGALGTLDAIMKSRPNLLAYDFTKSILDPEINDIFDVAVTRRVYHWFKKFADKTNEHHMSDDEIWIFEQKRLDYILKADSPAEDILWTI